MKQIRKRLTYANVMSSIAVFLVLGGATALAASQLGKNTVGAKQLKANAVTTAKIKKNAVTTKKIKKNAVVTGKIKDGAVTGPKVNLSTLGKVPSATTADTANSANNLTGRTPYSIFIGPGTRNIATVGPFTIRATCTINNGGDDEGLMELLTSVNGAAMDDNNEDGDEFTPFDISDNPAELYFESTGTGEEEIEVGSDPGLTAVAPDGTTVITQNETIGFNIAGHPGQCFFSGVVVKIG